MSKFTPEFKEQVIQHYNNNGKNKTKTAKEFNISMYSMKSFLDPKEKERNRKNAANHYGKIREGKEKEKYKRVIQKYCKVTPENILLKPHLSYEYPMSECFREFELLKEKTGNLNPVAGNKIVLTFQPHFYEKEKLMWLENNNNLRQNLVNNRKKYIERDEYQLTDKEVLRGFKISGKHIGFSHFNPLWMKYFIEKYNVNSVYDPTGGWGHRLLGAYNIKYIYNDLDTRTYRGCKAIADTFEMTDKYFYNEDAANFSPDEEYEAVFTCPPYYNVEIYQDTEYTSYEAYLDWWRDVVISASSNKEDVFAKYFAYVISNEYLEDTKKIVEEVFGRCIETTSIKDKINHFQNEKVIAKGEKMLVFSRE